MNALPPPDKTWLLDTFGTDGTVLDHQFWGRIRPLTDYPLNRFLTLIPGFSTRNTFLGAATVERRSEDSVTAQLPQRSWQCVLWSKVHPWLNSSLGWPAYHQNLLREYSKYCKVIATIDKQDTYKTERILRSCCPEVDVRNVQSPAAFRDLLQGSAVYVGVGEPLIAPSCFEALSVGTHVIQPRIPEPHAVPNKPITQKWTSQHPFLEQVPEPFAYTVDPLDFKALAETFKKLRAAYDSVYGGTATAEANPEAPSLNATLRKFYAAGEYPGREVYSTEGFLERVARVVNKTRRLTTEDWEWERQDHPQMLPDRAFHAQAAG
ncbi:gly-2 [Symbiodinium natans]|uniref:alpha-1,6-mannosyl-glycoprotein 6-beta-N-acetylglucosaminyltransferase n=1 Tax=Symbiodinium natans TaxID=878477 RepID=A0A812Q183_9DINO|nr:gly-2 [Symbiodinium natans]